MSRHQDDPGLKTRSREDGRPRCFYIQNMAAHSTINSPQYAKKDKSEARLGRAIRRVWHCVCVFFLGGGEGSVIIACSALDVPGTNCGSFVSLCSC